MILGHDIANVNGSLDLSDYPRAEFFIAKVSQDATFVDRLFHAFRGQARDLGKGFGGYHYGDNKAEPNARASCRRFVDLLGDQEDGEIAALDVESDSGNGGFDPGDHSEWVWAWGDEFILLKKYAPYLYTSDAGIEDYGLNDPLILVTFKLWYAYWLNNPTGTTPPEAPKPWKNFKLWQFNADDIDKNYFLGTLAEFKATGKAPNVPSYEETYWTPMQKLVDKLVANSVFPHADAAFHAVISNAITQHKISVDHENPI